MTHLGPEWTQLIGDNFFSGIRTSGVGDTVESQAGIP